MASSSLDIPVGRGAVERSVYTWGALAALLITFVGFAPSYYLKGVFGAPELTPLKHVHGLVMTAWLVTFLVQARLVATGRTLTHRKLGMAGAVLAVAVVSVGMATAAASARTGVSPVPGVPPLVFLVLPVIDMLTFALLVGAALALRKRPAWHKRLRLVGTLSMLTPAFARALILVLGTASPPAFFLLTDLVIVACLAYDWRRNGRVHPAFIVGLAAVVVLQFGRLPFSQTEAWMSFARWLVA